jgi:uncharacterized protein with HEPN domain/predicted nucleotidyltransferase
MTRDKVLSLLRAHKDALAQRFGVASLALFGSYARDQATQKSDVDVLVTFEGPATAQRHCDLQLYIQELLGRPVDLVIEKELRKELRPHVEAEAIDVSREGMPMPDPGRQPTREWRLYIEDMIEFCGRVLEYTSGLDQTAFVADSRTNDATMHNIALIGEAAANIPNAVRDAHPQIPWSRIIGTRNRIIHGYLSVDDDTVWEILREDIPGLVPQLKALFETQE